MVSNVCTGMTSKKFSSQDIAKVCDHTFLKTPEVAKKEISFGESAVRKREKEFYRFLEDTIHLPLSPYALCLRAVDIPHAYRFLESSGKTFPLTAVVGFPDGHWYKPNYKLFQAEYAMGEGAKEIDVTLNYQALKEGNHGFIIQEVQTITRAVHRQGGGVKLIIETSELTEQLIVQACRLAAHVGVDFVKTSTGFGAYGVQREKLESICQHFSGGIKISGSVTAYNVQSFLSLIQDIRGPSFMLSPENVRIGESGLLHQL